VVTHYHTEITDTYVFMVMEFCNYSDLESYYNKHAPLNMSDMNIMLKQLASGLKLLYEKKIIHRDLKPKVSSAWGQGLEEKGGSILSEGLLAKVATFFSRCALSVEIFCIEKPGVPVVSLVISVFA
jgi:hypothetical protein